MTSERGILRTAVVLAAPLLLAATAPPPPAAPPAVGIQTASVAGARRTDAVLPGRLVAIAFPRRSNGHRRVIALIESAELSGTEPTRDLYLVEPAGSGELLRLHGGLPGKAGMLSSTDLDGDGLEELLLGGPGTLWALGTADAAHLGQPLLERVDPRRLLGLAAGDLAAPEVGRLRTWRRTGERLTPGPSFELPVHARRSGNALRLETPDVEALPQPDGPPLYLVGPEENGKSRLRTLLLTPNADGTEQRNEAWSRFAAPETVNDHWFIRIDGRPMLIVTTTAADKVSIFEKQRLRVFPLATDRSRGGQPPVLSAPTESHRWFPAEPAVMDLDRDGREDLVVVQQEGLRGKSLLVEAFFGQGQGHGRFELPSRKVSLGTPARAWSYGADVTGDGRPDLVALEENRIVVFAGTADPRRDLLDRRPRASLPLPTSGRMVVTASVGTSGASVVPSHAADPLQVLDLDGDGRGEIVVSQRDDLGRGRITVVRLGPSDGP